MKLKYRKFRIRDAKQCAEIGRRIFREKLRVNSGGYIIDERGKEWRKYFSPLNLIWLHFVKRKNIRVAVDENETIVGLCGYSIEKFGVVHLELMFVDPDLHRKGIGKFLSENRLEEIGTKGYFYIELFSLLNAGEFALVNGFKHMPEYDEFRDHEKDPKFKNKPWVDPIASEKFRIPTVEGPVGLRFGYFMYKIL